MKNKTIMLIAAVIICELAGIIGSVFTYNSIPEWYDKLNKPGFTPPSWLFGPVWVTLYLLMGVSAYLVWEKGIKKKKISDSLAVFAVQLVLNALWSILFFGLRCPLCGFIGIVLLWTSIVLAIFKFHRISRTAAILLLPYLLWVTLAMVLNFYVWKLN